MLAATKVKMSGSEKNKNKNTYYISSIKRVTRNHVEVVQNNGKETCQKNCAWTGKVAFLLIRPIVVFLTVLVAFAA